MSFRNAFLNSVVTEDKETKQVRFDFNKPLDVPFTLDWHKWIGNIVALSNGCLDTSYACNQGSGGNIAKYNHAKELGFRPLFGYKASAPSVLQYLTLQINEAHIARFDLDAWLKQLATSDLLADVQVLQQAKSAVGQLLAQRRTEGFLSASNESVQVQQAAAPSLAS